MHYTQKLPYPGWFPTYNLSRWLRIVVLSAKDSRQMHSLCSYSCDETDVCQTFPCSYRVFWCWYHRGEQTAWLCELLSLRVDLLCKSLIYIYIYIYIYVMQTHNTNKSIIHNDLQQYCPSYNNKSWYFELELNSQVESVQLVCHATHTGGLI